MANPLAILGQIGAGLSTVGAGGAGGALAGALQGESLARKFQTEDEQNKLRVLQGLLMQQQMGPQYKVDPHGRVILETPGQPPRMTGQFPPTAGEASLIAEREALAAWRKKQAEQGPQAGSLEDWMGKAKPQNLSEYLEALRQYQATQHPPKAPGETRPTVVQPSGSIYDPETKTFKQAPGRPGGASSGDYTTTVQGEQITPRKPLKLDSPEVKGLNEALDPTAKTNVILEIEGDFAKKGANFRVPGSWVKLPSGRLVRKEDVIADRLLTDYGAETTVRWNPATKRFVVVEAWHPTQREQTQRTTTRTRGARPPQPQEEE